MSVQPAADEASNISVLPTGGERPPAAAPPEPAAPTPKSPGAARDTAIRLLIALAIGAMGVVLLVLVSSIKTSEDLEALVARLTIYRAASQVLFVLALGVLVSGITRQTPFQALTAFLVSLEPVQELVEQAIGQTWKDAAPALTQVFVKVVPETVFLVVIGLYAIGFAVGILILRPGADPRRPVARHEDDVLVNAPTSAAALRALEARRRRIKAYFSPRPVWPIVAAIAAVGLLLFALAGQFSAQEQLFLGWMAVASSLFGISGLALLWEDRARKPMFYLNLFVSLILVGSEILDRWTGYPYTVRLGLLQQGNDLNAKYEATKDATLQAQFDQVLAALSSYYFWYWVALAAAVLVYALVFRFVVYRYLHLATDQEVDATIAEDMKQVSSRAFRRLGVDRTRLIAEPLNLRGFPDRSAVGNVFFGSWIGDDDRLRFTPQSATVIAFTEAQTLYYETSIDLTTGVVVSETNVEFFYQDVSTVMRTSATQVLDMNSLSSYLTRIRNMFSRSESARNRELKNRSVNDTLQMPGRDVFQIVLDNGRTLNVVLRDSSFFDMKKKRIVWVLSGVVPAIGAAPGKANADLPVDENERAMRNVRSMLRDKKRALLIEQA